MDRTKTSPQAQIDRLNDDNRFHGLADEITTNSYAVIFRFGGYDYALSAYSMSYNSLSEIYDIVCRHKKFLESRRDKK